VKILSTLFVMVTAVACAACSPDEPAAPRDVVADTDAEPPDLSAEEVPLLRIEGGAELLVVSGQFRAPCAENSECDNGYCVLTLSGKVCSKNCASSCEHPEFICDQAPGGDPVFICVPKHTAEVCDGIDNDGDFKVDEDLCEDGNPCTLDECNLGGPQGSCKHVELNGNSCFDGSACTEADTCINGVCKGGAKKKCVDGNPCTKDDVCDPASGCQFPPQAGPCDDGNPCTGIGSDEKQVAPDTCASGECKPGAPSHCDDNNPCTSNLCKPAGGCYFKAVPDQPNNGCPKDGDPSTVEWCVAGQCSYK
jgi:hypothetical protein